MFIVKTRWHTLPKTHAPPPTAFSVPNKNVLYLRETKLWRCERRRRRGGGGGGGRGENVHLLTHAATLADVGKNGIFFVLYLVYCI